MKKSVNIYSEGVRMSGTLYSPEIEEGKRYPVVVFCHGWTAPLMNHLEASKLPHKLAEQGFFALTFDARGWGESDGVPLVVGEVPPDGQEGTARVRIVRGILDPMSWLVDIQHAIDFVEGEPAIDPDRIGVWGSSFGGGTALAIAATDPRVKCAVSQIGALDMRGVDRDPDANMPMWTDAALRDLAIEQARKGNLPHHVVPSQVIADAMQIEVQPLAINPGLRLYNPVDIAARVTVPTLILDAENEPHWDIARHGGAAFDNLRAAGNTVSEYIVVKGIGHDLSTYFQMAEDAPEAELATEAVRWFGQHL